MRLQQANSAQVLHQRAQSEYKRIRDRFERSTAVPAYIEPILAKQKAQVQQHLADFEDALPKSGLPVPALRLNDSNQEDWIEPVGEAVALNSALLPPTHLREDRPHPSLIVAAATEGLEDNCEQNIEFVE